MKKAKVKMNVLLLIDHEVMNCRIYINCNSLKKAKLKGLNTKGDWYKFYTIEEAEKEAKKMMGYNIKYLTL
jgi:hypothetical protein